MLDGVPLHALAFFKRLGRLPLSDCIGREGKLLAKIDELCRVWASDTEPLPSVNLLLDNAFDERESGKREMMEANEALCQTLLTLSDYFEKNQPSGAPLVELRVMAVVIMILNEPMFDPTAIAKPQDVALKYLAQRLTHSLDVMKSEQK